MIPRRTFIPPNSALAALLLVLVAPLFADVAPPVTAEAVTILVDASYSMSLPDGAGTRLETLGERLFDWLASQPADTRYALLVAEHGAEADLRLPYPASARQVLTEFAATLPWGSIDLGRALTAAADVAASIASANGDTGARLLLITDGEDIAALLPARDVRLPSGVRYESIRLTPRTPASVAAFVDGLADLPTSHLSSPAPPQTGVTSREEPQRTAPPAQPSRTTSSPQRSAPTASPAPANEAAAAAGSARAVVTPAAAPAARDGLLARWAGPARWAFAAATVVGIVAAARARSRHRRRVSSAVAHNSRPPEVPVEIRGPGGRARAVIDSFPTALTTGGLRVEHADLARVEQTVRLEHAEGRILLRSEEKVKVNGVPRNEHEIGDRDQVRVGAVRIVIGEIRRVAPVRMPRPTHRFYPLAPASAAAVAVVAFLLAPPQITVAPLRAAAGAPSSGSGAHTIVADTTIDGGTVRRTRDAVDTAPASAALPTTAVPADRPPARTGVPARVAAGSLSRAAADLPQLRLPIVVGPADELPPFDADFVAIHAHPDDESLDFGAAVAAMTASGLRGAVVLLTDGDAGLDQYPWREVGPDYPAYDMKGDELARVRVAEAREAIGWLGAEYYIRMGLPNHPYGSLAEVLPLAETFGRWGGRDAVVSRLERIVERLSPEIVISPDGPSAALEHFEHEATGVLVREALRSLAETGRSPVQAHLVTVDPLQLKLEEAELELLPWAPAADGTIPRMRQLLALRAHRTQRDATVIGVETRLAIPGEYYRLAYVAPGFVVERYLEQLGPYGSLPGTNRPESTSGSTSES